MKKSRSKLIIEEDLELEWTNFCEDDLDNSDVDVDVDIDIHNNDVVKVSHPKCTNLYISTKTKICYLNKPIDLKKVFWQIPIIPYHTPKIGVVKKQMKFNSISQEELSLILDKLPDYEYVDNYIINQIINPDGRIKFKDIRKISIGLSKKDITSYRCKKKSAFYNCFVVILRLLQNDKFKEINVKVFNTGQLEIPGIQDDVTLDTVLKMLIRVLSPYTDTDTDTGTDTSARCTGTSTDTLPLTYLPENSSTVLINSNFNCGYYINRDSLYNLLKYKYKISSNYDPCSYPGIQCSFYYDLKLQKQTGMMPVGFVCNKKMKKIKDPTLNIGITSVSVMIFRTGSMLIVGKCTEDILYNIYDFLCNLFETEYANIADNQYNVSTLIKKNNSIKTVRKIRKKTIYCNSL
jgi:hypothetical protein